MYLKEEGRRGCSAVSWVYGPLGLLCLATPILEVVSSGCTVDIHDINVCKRTHHGLNITPLKNMWLGELWSRIGGSHHLDIDITQRTNPIRLDRFVWCKLFMNILSYFL